jgi:RNA polymerase sigma-70 factor, ECF subfamily
MEEYQTDQEIIQQVLQGKVNAFRLLVDRYKQRVARLGRRFFANPEQIADFSQEVFLKTYEHLAGFEGRSAFSLWLYRIALHTALNIKKKEMILPLPMETAQMDTSEEVTSIDWSLENSTDPDLKILIQDALNQLPEIYRGVLHFVHYEKMKYAEVAEILDVSENTIKSYVYRAKDILRKKFDKTLVFSNK